MSQKTQDERERSRQFHGKVALITGSSQGIGRAVAEILADRGAAVVINYPTTKEEEQARAVVELIRAAGGRATAVMADVTHTGEVRELFDRTTDTFGGIDFVVSNAGSAMALRPIQDFTTDLYDAVTSLNARAQFFVLQQAARCIRDHGRIVALSSSTTRRPYAGASAYAGAKAAVELYCRVLSQEVGARGITVNSVSPGLTDTEGMRAAAISSSRLAAVVSETPLGRLGTAKDIARVIAMLLTEDAQWVTGQHINAGGGAFA